MTDATATQMAEGGWNLVWCRENELDVAGRHGLRAQLQDPLLQPSSLDGPAQRKKLDDLINRVRKNPALYSYFITDEPNASQFPALARLVAYLRQRDPAHLAYINLFPTYANNGQLGEQGKTVEAYDAYLRDYVHTVKPALISYDHYQFTTRGDSSQYFLNLALIRRAAQDAGVPFLNIVQACTWSPSMRVPNGDEMRYLVYTSMAYGAQGVSYFVYSNPGCRGGIAKADGTPTPLYSALKVLNHDFVAIARQLQPLRSLGVFHAGMLPPGTEPPPKDSPLHLDPPVAPMAYKAPEPVKGVLFGFFGPRGGTTNLSSATQSLVVNLDYDSSTVLGLRASGPLQTFQPATGHWSAARAGGTRLRLPPGGGMLIRLGR
jgi:hypothetical protein